MLIGLDYIAVVMKNGTYRFPKEAKGILSLFCLGPDAHGVTLEGLQYPLENGTLTSGFPLGVSNHFIGEPAWVTVENGTVIAIYDRANGLITGENT